MDRADLLSSITVTEAGVAGFREILPDTNQRFKFLFGAREYKPFAEYDICLHSLENKLNERMWNDYRSSLHEAANFLLILVKTEPALVAELLTSPLKINFYVSHSGCKGNTYPLGENAAYPLYAVATDKFFQLVNQLPEEAQREVCTLPGVGWSMFRKTANSDAVAHVNSFSRQNRWGALSAIFEHHTAETSGWDIKTNRYVMVAKPYQGVVPKWLGDDVTPADQQAVLASPDTHPLLLTAISESIASQAAARANEKRVEACAYRPGPPRAAQRGMIPEAFPG